MKNITISISHYVALHVGYKEFSIIDNQTAARIVTAERDLPPVTFNLDHDVDGESFYLEMLPAEKGKDTIFRLWPKQAWLNSLEHRKRLQEESERSRQANFLKVEVWEKLRVSLGLPCGGISGSGIMEIVKAMKASNPSCLMSLGLTQQEIDAI